MSRKIFLLIMIPIFSLGILTEISGQEILLDKGIKAGNLDCFPVYKDETAYYYLPVHPRLATKDGRPQFSFIKYVGNVPGGGEGGIKEGEGGGIVHFLVEYGATEEERMEAEMELQRQVPGARLVGPVIYRGGTFALVTSFRGENGELAKEVVGLGKAPIMEGHKAAVSIHLTQRGATLLWESFRNPTSQISVSFEMEARGYRKPYEATLEADWEKISKHHQVSIGAKYKWLGVDIDLLFQDLRKTGAIKVVTKGTSEEMDKMWQSAYNLLLTQMFEKDDTLDVLSALQKGDTGFNNMDKALDFLKQEEERKAKEKKASNIIPYEASDDSENGHGPFMKTEGSGPEKISVQGQEQKPASQEFEELIQKANAFLKDKNYFEAIYHYKKAYDLCLKPYLLYQIGIVYQNFLQDMDNASKYFNQYKKAVKAAPGVSSQVMDAMAEEAKEINKQALRVAKRAERVASSKVKKKKLEQKEKDDCEKASEFEDEGFRYHLDGKYQESIEAYQKAYELCPDPLFLRNIATLYDVYLEEKDNALAYYKKLLEELKPENETEEKIYENAKTRVQELEEAKSEDTGAVAQEQKKEEEKKEEAKPSEKKLAQEIEEIADKKKEPEKAKEKAEEKKAEEKKPEAKKADKKKEESSGTSGFAIIASYRMRRIKQSGKAVINLNQWREESLIFRFDENIGNMNRYVDNPDYFRAVNLDDPVYKQREIIVMLDGQDSDDFKSYINYVSVQLKKKHQDGQVTYDELKIDKSNFDSQNNNFRMMYGWKGDNDRPKWMRYDYRTRWSFHGGVEKEEDWKTTDDFVVNVTPPHRYRKILLEADPSEFRDREVRDASVKFYTNFYGKEMVQQITIRTREEVFTRGLEYAHPEGNFDYEYEITWHLRGGTVLNSGRLKGTGDVIYCDEFPDG